MRRIPGSVGKTPALSAAGAVTLGGLGQFGAGQPSGAAVDLSGGFIYNREDRVDLVSGTESYLLREARCSADGLL